MTAVRSAVLRHRDALIDATTATKICCHDCRFDLLHPDPATTAIKTCRHDLSP